MESPLQEQQHIISFSEALTNFIDGNVHKLIQLNKDGVIETIHPLLSELIGVEQIGCVGKPLKSIQFSADKLTSTENVTCLKSKEELQQKLLEQSTLNLEKDTLIAILAHDLINNLNAIQGFSSLLKDNFRSFNDEKIEKYLQVIDDSAMNASNLFEDTLKWIHTANGFMNFNPNEYNIATIIHEELLKLQHEISEKNIKVVVEIEPNAVVMCDSYMMKTVFHNLILNAIKFSFEGGEVRLKLTELETHHLISISDRGVGIQKEKIERVFEISENKSTLGTKNEKGTGLGLMICKEFIKKHQGFIKVQSEVGVGSQFQIMIPKLDSNFKN